MRREVPEKSITVVVDNPKEKATQVFAIRLSLAVGVLMLGGKWYAYAITGSAAILSDAAESVVHIAAVAFAAFSMWLSFRPPDESHPYGHDKVSYFSAGTEGSLIILAAAFIIFESIRRLVAGVELFNLDTGTLFVFGASAINLGLGGYLVWQGKRSKSLILIANGKHVLTDSWTSFGVVAGLLLTMATGWLPFDPLIASAVAVNIDEDTPMKVGLLEMTSKRRGVTGVCNQTGCGGGGNYGWGRARDTGEGG